jgi:hypothetical protein
VQPLRNRRPAQLAAAIAAARKRRCPVIMSKIESKIGYAWDRLLLYGMGHRVLEASHVAPERMVPEWSIAFGAGHVASMPAFGGHRTRISGPTERLGPSKMTHWSFAQVSSCKRQPHNLLAPVSQLQGCDRL